MTKDEFIPSLSAKAQNIVEQNLHKFSELNFDVFYSNYSKIVSDGSSHYIIYVSDKVKEDIEYRFLHEFFHCVQGEEGFPTIISQNKEHKELAIYLSSIILDLDVRERLEKNGYYQDLKYIKETTKAQIYHLKQLRQYPILREQIDINEIISTSGLLITNDVANVDNTELIKFLKMTMPQVIKYYKIFCDCINKYSYSNPEDVRKIFETLIDKFDFSSYMEIT